VVRRQYSSWLTGNHRHPHTAFPGGSALLKGPALPAWLRRKVSQGPLSEVKYQRVVVDTCAFSSAKWIANRRLFRPRRREAPSALPQIVGGGWDVGHAVGRVQKRERRVLADDQRFSGVPFTS
jgi:hypothetical protein